MRLKNAYKNAKHGAELYDPRTMEGHIVGMGNGGKKLKYTPAPQGRVYSDNTRVVTPDTTPTERETEIALQKRVGRISQGKIKTAYEKAKDASSFVEREKQRTGNASPISYVMDAVNPANVAFSAIDLVGNTGSAIKNTAQGNFSEAGSDLLQAGVNALGVLPAASQLKNIAKPLSKLARISPSQYKSVQQFANNPLNKTGEFLTTKTPLKDAYKLNSKAVKENPEMFLYRARPVGQDPNVNMAATFKAKEASGEVLPWWQKNIMNSQPSAELVAREKYYGKWFEKDPTRLDYYLNPETTNFNSKDKLEILRTKLPTSEGKKLNVSNFSDANTLTASPETEFILPNKLINSAEKFPANSWSRLKEEHTKFNTPHWLKGYKKPEMKKGGNILNRPITCSSCGHSWTVSASGPNPLSCHNCGGIAKMQMGGLSKMPNGGVLPADYTQFEKFHKSLPSNLQDSNYKYNDPNNYNLYGMWEGAGKPLSFNNVKDGELFPLQDDGTYHGFSVNPNTGEFLKPKNHKSTWMEVRESQLNPNLQDQRIIQNENGRLQYVPRTMRDGGKYLPTAVSQQLTKRPSSGLKEAYKRRKKL